MQVSILQTRIHCTLARGGTSKGAYFLSDDLPANPELCDRVLLSQMGSPDPCQIDGIGGADSLTSKVAFIKKSSRPKVDIDYLFIQVAVEQALTTTKQNCGNILAGVGPVAIEWGLIEAQDPETLVTVYMENTDSIARLRIQTPQGQVNYQGDAAIDGVPATHAPIMNEFLDIAGSSCGALFPSGQTQYVIDDITVTMVDNGMPVVVITAASMGKSGYESRDELENDKELKQRLESIRLQAGQLMKLGNVKEKTVPKMTLVSPPQNKGVITTRSFIPHSVHAAIGVLAAVSVATACVFADTVAHPVAMLPDGNPKLISIEHPSGEFSVQLGLDDDSSPQPNIKNTELLRTARSLFHGHVLVPASIWDGKQ